MSWRQRLDRLRRSGPRVRGVVRGEEAKGDLAIAVYKLRHLRGLSQQALAKAVGTGQSNVSAIERGEGNPTLETLGKIAGVFDVPVYRLLAPREVRESTPEEVSSWLVSLASSIEVHHHVLSLRAFQDASFAVEESPLIEEYRLESGRLVRVERPRPSEWAPSGEGVMLSA